MAWATTNSPSGWNVTDQECVKMLTYLLLENGNADATGTTTIFGQFTTTELLAALNDRQRKFMRDVGLVLTRATQDSTPQQSRYQLPGDWLSTERLSWQAQTAGSSLYPLERVDAYELDHGMTDWMYQDDLPSVYSEAPLPTLSVDVVKAPSDAGSLGLLYTALPTTLDGSGVKLSVPDEFAHVPVWGAVADVLESDVESSDPERAAYAESRYQLGVELAKLMLQGPMAMMGGDNGAGQ
jgi:hypothetical protein